MAWVAAASMCLAGGLAWLASSMDGGWRRRRGSDGKNKAVHVSVTPAAALSIFGRQSAITIDHQLTSHQHRKSSILQLISNFLLFFASI